MYISPLSFSMWSLFKSASSLWQIKGDCKYFATPPTGRYNIIPAPQKRVPTSVLLKWCGTSETLSFLARLLEYARALRYVATTVAAGLQRHHHPARNPNQAEGFLKEEVPHGETGKPKTREIPHQRGVNPSPGRSLPAPTTLADATEVWWITHLSPSCISDPPGCEQIKILRYEVGRTLSRHTKKLEQHQ